MFSLAAEMVRETRSLEMREERGVVRASEDRTIQQQMKEGTPPRGIPFTEKERELRVESFACQHALDAGAREYSECRNLELDERILRAIDVDSRDMTRAGR